MNYDKLKAELLADPLGCDYAEMTDEQVAADLNLAYRSRLKKSMSGDEVFQQTAAAEFAALSDQKRILWLSFCGRDSIDPVATANVAFVKWVFGVSSATVANLVAARQEAITRAAELGLPRVKPGHVQDVRRVN